MSVRDAVNAVEKTDDKCYEHGGVVRVLPIKRVQTKKRNSSKKTILARIKRSKYFPEISEMIKNGYHISFIVDCIHNDLGIMADLTNEQLKGVLKNYRNSLPPAEISEHIIPRRFLEKMKELDEELNVLREMTNLYHLQRDRVSLVGGHEKKLGMLFPTTVREIDMCLEILKAASELKMSLGIDNRHLGTLEIDARTMAMLDGDISDKTAARRVLNNPESRRKILQLADNIVSLRPELQGKLLVKNDNSE